MKLLKGMLLGSAYMAEANNAKTCNLNDLPDFPASNGSWHCSPHPANNHGIVKGRSVCYLQCDTGYKLHSCKFKNIFYDPLKLFQIMFTKLTYAVIMDDGEIQDL